MNVDDCIEKGLLKKDKPNLDKSKKSIEVARYKLKTAKKIFKSNIFDQSIVNAYAAMFHASRSLLFRDGFIEKSHYALYIYVKEKYSTKLEKRFINELNVLRLERHEISYGLDIPKTNEEDAKDILKITEEYIEKVDSLLY